MPNEVDLEAGTLLAGATQTALQVRPDAVADSRLPDIVLANAPD